jgi:hypothetical protein
LLKVLLVSVGKGDPSLNHWYVIGSDPVTKQFNIMDSPAKISTLEGSSVNFTPTAQPKYIT